MSGGNHARYFLNSSTASNVFAKHNIVRVPTASSSEDVDATGDIGFGGEDSEDHDIEMGSEAEIEHGTAQKQGKFGLFSLFESSLILPGLPLVIASGSKSGKRKRSLTHANNKPLGELDTSIRREFLCYGLSN